MTTKHTSDTHEATPTTGPPSIHDAAVELVSALNQIGPQRLGHGYGCLAESAGPCTCGTAELKDALQKMAEALTPATHTSAA